MRVACDKQTFKHSCRPLDQRIGKPRGAVLLKLKVTWLQQQILRLCFMLHLVPYGCYIVPGGASSFGRRRDPCTRVVKVDGALYLRQRGTV